MGNKLVLSVCRQPILPSAPIQEQPTIHQVSHRASTVNCEHVLDLASVLVRPALLHFLSRTSEVDAGESQI